MYVEIPLDGSLDAGSTPATSISLRLKRSGGEDCHAEASIYRSKGGQF